MPKRYHGEGRTHCTLNPYVTNRANPCLEGRAAPRLCMWGCTRFGALRTARGVPQGWRAQHCLGQCGVPVGGGGWGHPTTGAGHAACWAARPSCTSPQQQPHCSLGIDAGCSLQVLFAQGAATVSCRASSFVPTPQPGPALAAVLLRVPPCPSMSIGGGEGMNQRGMLAAPAPGEAHPWSACIASAPWSTRGQGTVSHWYAAPLPHSITPRYARSPFVPI